MNSTWTDDGWAGEDLESDHSLFVRQEAVLKFPLQVATFDELSCCWWFTARTNSASNASYSRFISDVWECFKTPFSSWIIALFSSFLNRRPFFFIPGKETVKMKKACGAPAHAQNFSAVKPNNWRQRQNESEGENKKGKKGLFLQRCSSLLLWIPSEPRDSPSSEQTNGTEDHLVQYSPT